MKYDILTSFCVYGMYIKNISRRGGKYMSPFRDELVPSFSIDGISGRWYDFGLGMGGDVVAFVQALHKCSYSQACGIIDRELDGYDRAEMVYKCGTLDTSKVKNKRVYKLSRKIVDGYSNTLMTGGVIHDDMINRGITYSGMLKYKLGVQLYAGKRWLVIPYEYNLDVCSNYKKIHWGEKGKEVITSGKGTIYPSTILNENDDIVLCEGELDALSFNCNGIPAVSGTVGCGTFKKEWVSLFKDKRVRIIYDFDEPGYKGSNMVENMLKDVCNCAVYTWDSIVEQPYKGFDSCDYFKHNGSPAMIKTILEM